MWEDPESRHAAQSKGEALSFVLTDCTSSKCEVYNVLSKKGLSVIPKQRSCKSHCPSNDTDVYSSLPCHLQKERELRAQKQTGQQ